VPLLLSCRSCLGALAGSLNAADDGGLRVEDGNILILKVTCNDVLADTKLGDVYIKLVREVLHKSADAKLAYVLNEFTTGLNTCCVSCDVERHLDCDGLLFVYLEEVYVEANVLDGVELKLVYNCCVLLAVKYKVYDVRCRSVGKTLEILGINSEKNVLKSKTVKVARNETLCADSLDGCFVANLTKLALQLKMLHN